MDRHRRLFALVFLLAGAARAGSLEPPPGPVSPTMKALDEVEARTPIHQSDLPLAITVDGSYYLAENLYAAQGGQDMITVLATNASIDLNGFTINGTSQVAQAADCIQVESSVRTFSLRNGFIRGCGGSGVIYNGANPLSVSVTHVNSDANGGDGIMLGGLGPYGVVSECVAKSNGGRGIYLTEGVIEKSVANNNGTIGLQVNTGLIRGCMAKFNAGLNAAILSGGNSVDNYIP